MTTARYSEIDWYDTPLYYDIVFDEDTVREADFLEALLARHGPAPRARSADRARSKDRDRLRTSAPFRVLEPACGSGRLVAELAARGARVTGFDKSAAMLAFTRERLAARGLEAELRVAALEDFRFRQRFELAHCLVSTFKYLLDETSARAHLECVARSLLAGGIYVLGFHLTDYAATGVNRERWVAERGGTHVVCNIQGWPAERRKRVERVRSRLVVRENGRESRAETNWLFRTYDTAEFRRLLRSVPAFEHVATHDFNYDLEERTFDDDQLDCVLVLRKKRNA